MSSIRNFVTGLILTLGLVEPTYANNNELCKMMGNYAESIMTHRQSGVPASDVVDTFVSKESESDYLVESIVIEAFKLPVYASNESRLKAINSFKDSVYLSCLKASIDAHN